PRMLKIRIFAGALSMKQIAKIKISFGFFAVGAVAMAALFVGSSVAVAQSASSPDNGAIPAEGAVGDQGVSQSAANETVESRRERCYAEPSSYYDCYRLGVLLGNRSSEGAMSTVARSEILKAYERG